MYLVTRALSMSTGYVVLAHLASTSRLDKLTEMIWHHSSCGEGKYMNGLITHQVQDELINIKPQLWSWMGRREENLTGHCTSD